MPLSLPVMKTKLLLFSHLFSPFSFLLFTFSLLLSPCIAQVPQGFNYQAIARGSDGKEILNASVLVKISILSDTTGFYGSGSGTYIWEEQQTVKTNNFGLFTLNVGNPLATKVQGSAVSFSAIDWKQQPLFIGIKLNQSGWRNMGTARLLSVPYSMVAGELGGAIDKLEVIGIDPLSDEALFEVKRKDGQTMFAVYNYGVRVYMPLDTLSKAKKGGFAIGGFDKAKGVVQDYFVVNPDSIRAYIDTNTAKAKKGGFAIGGFDKAKAGNEEYLRVTRDSTRIYLNDTGVKAKKGGFAIGGFDKAKGDIQDFMTVSSDSIRIYIDDNLTKALKGGFAIGGFDKAKGGNASFLNVATDASGKINPSQNRILWYPLKNAFLTGRVLITDSSGVGINSFATGYESKAKGRYSQAMGFKAIANGDYSTAIGKNSTSSGNSSFSFGDGTIASGDGSYSFGTSALASGKGSFAFGSLGRDSLGNITGQKTQATAENSFAFGLGAKATKQGAIAIGSNNIASGDFSFCAGYVNTTSGRFSTAFGAGSLASGFKSAAFGTSTASGEFSNSLGLYAVASNSFATAIGRSNLASGTFSTAIGFGAQATGDHAFAVGMGAVASGSSSTSFGYAGTTASGSYTFAQGFNSKASGLHSIAFGPGNISSGISSAAFGSYTSATGGYSTSFGVTTYAKSYASFVVGRYNVIAGDSLSWLAADPLFVVGNGQKYYSGGSWHYLPSNAFTVLKNGNAMVQGNLQIGNSSGPITENWWEFGVDNGNGTGIDFHTNTSAIDYSARVYRNPGNNGELQIINTGTGALAFFTSNIRRITISSTGYIGIGTSAPTYPLHIATANTPPASFSYGYLNSGGVTGTSAGSNYYSIFSEYRIRAEEFNADSDVRIKKIKGISNAEEDMEILKQIRITDFSYIDSISKGNGIHKKVIAQELNEIYPNSVTTTRSFIPSVYAKPISSIFSIENRRMVFTMQKEHGLKPGDNVKFIEPEGTWNSKVAEVVTPSIFTIESFKDHSNIFVFGKEVSDFLTVDYEAVSMLNVSVTQELIRKTEIQQKQIDSQNERIERLEKIIEEMQGVITASRSR